MGTNKVLIRKKVLKKKVLKKEKNGSHLSSCDLHKMGANICSKFADAPFLC